MIGIQSKVNTMLAHKFKQHSFFVVSEECDPDHHGT